jgi:hypothetical protein
MPMRKLEVYSLNTCQRRFIYCVGERSWDGSLALRLRKWVIPANVSEFCFRGEYFNLLISHITQRSIDCSTKLGWSTKTRYFAGWSGLVVSYACI